MAEPNNITDSQSDDARLLAEDIAAGEQKAPKVDVSSDYEASKEYSTSSVDDTSAGAKAAEEATGSKFDIPAAEQTQSTGETSSDPDAFRSMAKDVNPQASDAPSS